MARARQTPYKVLVFINSEYGGRFSSLPGTRRDAEVLENCKFMQGAASKYRHDTLSLGDMSSELHAWMNTWETNNTAMLFYFGHGMYYEDGNAPCMVSADDKLIDIPNLIHQVQSVTTCVTVCCFFVFDIHAGEASAKSHTRGVGYWYAFPCKPGRGMRDVALLKDEDWTTYTRVSAEAFVWL